MEDLGSKLLKEDTDKQLYSILHGKAVLILAFKNSGFNPGTWEQTAEKRKHYGTHSNGIGKEHDCNNNDEPRDITPCPP